MSPVSVSHDRQTREPLLAEYITLFNDRYFYDCHEVAEDLWIEVADDPDPTRPDRDFLRGLIHAATAYQHLFRRNRRGFEARAHSTLQLLANLPAHHHGIAVGRIRENLQHWLQQLDPNPEAPLPPYRDSAVPRL
jgi:predicted metal-dependent hydrolase